MSSELKDEYAPAPGLTVHTVLCRAGAMDNYSYIIVDDATGTTAVIDPSEAKPIIDKCKKLGLKPSYILNTHHHFDHTDANQELKQTYGAEVIGNDTDRNRIPGFDRGVKDGETFYIGRSSAQIIDVSGHTQGHILWYFPANKIVFTGDTLFNLCIGGLFEGTPEQMYASLQKLKNLPDDTLFYPGHEYTMMAASDAWCNLPDDPMLLAYVERARRRLAAGLPVSPLPLSIEKHCNPYLRAAELEAFKNIT